jgi:hypothetical protein
MMLLFILLFCIKHDYKLNYDNTRVSILNPSAQICFANFRYLHFNLQTSLFIINHNHKIAARGAKSILSLRCGFYPASARDVVEWKFFNID